jgi:RNA polymerase sigma factor (sigma-70 family)
MHATEPSLAPVHRPAEAQLRPFHVLYRAEFAFVWSVARRLGVPPGALEDAVQDVFITAYRRLDQLRFEVSPRAWLHGITRRIASRYRRTAFRRARRLAAFADLDDGPDAPPQERVVAAQHLDRLLTGLGPGTRMVFEMTELLGMSGPEIASELGLPLNTVYSRIRLARQQLQRVLADPQQLERWIAEARTQQAPPEGAEQRGWMVLAPALARPGAAVGLGLLASTRVVFATTLIAVAAVVAMVVPRGGPPASPPSREPAPVNESIASMQRDAPVAAAVLAPPVPVAPQRPRAARPAPSAPDRLAEEVALLDRANARLGAGDAAGALAAIAEHGREFPQGALLDLREAARVQALCLAGDRVQADAVAARLFAEHPGSAVAQRHANFSNVCGEGSPAGRR